MSRVIIPTTSRHVGNKNASFCGNPNPYPDDSQAVNGSQHAGVGLPPEAKLRHGVSVLCAALALLQSSGAAGTASAAKARTAPHTRMRVTDTSHSERTFPTIIIKRRLRETASSPRAFCDLLRICLVLVSPLSPTRCARTRLSVSSLSRDVALLCLWSERANPRGGKRGKKHLARALLFSAK